MKNSIKYRHIILFALIIFALSPANRAFALYFGEYNISSDSRIWFEGSSTLNDYSCGTNEINGYAYLDSSNGYARVSSRNSRFFANATFFLEVKQLDCGNKLMNKDMYNALLYEKYPHISYDLYEAKLLSVNEAEKYSLVSTNGFLTVAGTTNLISFTVKITEIGRNTFRIIGSKDISMRDYGITPPTALFGLIKAGDKLKVNFDLIVSTKSNYPLKSER